LWQPELSGHPYYTFREYPPKTLGERVKRSVMGKSLEYTISDEIRSFIQGGSVPD